MFFKDFIYLLMREREREAETQAEGEAGSMSLEPDVGFDPGSPGLSPGPKAGAKPLRHPGIPWPVFLMGLLSFPNGSVWVLCAPSDFEGAACQVLVSKLSHPAAG